MSSTDWNRDAINSRPCARCKIAAHDNKVNAWRAERRYKWENRKDFLLEMAAGIILGALVGTGLALGLWAILR